MQSTHKARRDHNERRSSRLAGLLVGLVLLATPMFATAADGSETSQRDLLTYLPADSRFASHIEVDQLRTTKYFDQALNYLERDSSKKGTRIAEFLTGEDGFNIKQDLETLAVGLPVSRIQSPEEADKATFALAGDFDADAIRTMAKKEGEKVGSRTHAGLKLTRVDGVEFGFPSSNRLIVTRGPESYRNAVWHLATEGGKSFVDSAGERNLFEGLDRSRPLWMVNYLKGALDRGDARVDSAGVSVNIDNGVELQIVSHVADQPHAETVVKQIQAMKTSAAENPMITMIGASPLLTNLSVQRNGTTVVATTSMTEPQLDALVANLRQLVATQTTQSIPSQGSTDDETSSKDDTN